MSSLDTKFFIGHNRNTSNTNKENIMATVDLRGWDTQLNPMAAITEIVNDNLNGHVDAKTAMSYINAICCEWRF
jgi:hypothetical protein